MPSTDRRLELKAKDIDGSDRVTAGCVCQWVKQIETNEPKFVQYLDKGTHHYVQKFDQCSSLN